VLALSKNLPTVDPCGVYAQSMESMSWANFQFKWPWPEVLLVASNATNATQDLLDQCNVSLAGGAFGNGAYGKGAYGNGSVGTRNGSYYGGIDGGAPTALAAFVQTGKGVAAGGEGTSEGVVPPTKQSSVRNSTLADGTVVLQCQSTSAAGKGTRELQAKFLGNAFWFAVALALGGLVHYAIIKVRLGPWGP
jgi:hypothetical protein